MNFIFINKLQIPLYKCVLIRIYPLIILLINLELLPTGQAKNKREWREKKKVPLTFQYGDITKSWPEINFIYLFIFFIKYILQTSYICYTSF